MNDKVFDNPSTLGYNTSNDDHVVVKMDEQPPINDTSCRHKNLVVPDPDDTIGDAVAHMCANSKCGVGFYIRTQK